MWLTFSTESGSGFITPTEQEISDVLVGRDRTFLKKWGDEKEQRKRRCKFKVDLIFKMDVKI